MPAKSLATGLIRKNALGYPNEPISLEMSLLLCPLCFKSTSLRSFHPSSFPLNICVQEVKGLGRGRGFRVVSRTPILYQPEFKQIRGMIGARVLELLELLVRTGDISKDQVLVQLRSGPRRDETNARDDEVRALKAALEESNRRFTKSEQEGEALSARIVSLEDEAKSYRASKEESETELASVESDFETILGKLGLSTVVYLGGTAEMLRRIRDELSEIESKTDFLLSRLDMNPFQYQSLAEKVDALGNEVEASLALRE